MRRYQVPRGNASRDSGERARPGERATRAVRMPVPLTCLIVLAVLAGGFVVGFAAIFALSGPAARPAVLTATTSGCVARPASVALAGSFSEMLVPTPTPTPTAASTATDTLAPTSTPTPTLTPTPTPIPTPTPTPTPTTPTPTPTPTTPTPTPTPSKTPTKRPTPTPTKPRRPTRSPTPTRTPAPSATPQLCVQVQPSSGTVVRPGQTASYAIWVWAAGRASNPAVVQIQATRAVGVSGPRFVTCPAANRTSCSVGRLSVNQSGVLSASVSVSSQAIGGELLELLATVSAAGVPPASAWAVIDVVTPTPGDPSGKLTPTALELGQVGGDVPPLLPLPGVAPVNPTSLFPSVSPGSGSGPQAPGGASRRSHVEAVTASAVTPMNTLIGAQIVGVAVLVGAIVIGFVRVSLRVPRPSGGPGRPQQSSGQQLARPRPGWARRWYTRARQAK